MSIMSLFVSIEILNEPIISQEKNIFIHWSSQNVEKTANLFAVFKLVTIKCYTKLKCIMLVYRSSKILQNIL